MSSRRVETRGRDREAPIQPPFTNPRWVRDARPVKAVQLPAAWRVSARLQELAGEERANILRVLGIAVFYAVEVLNRYGVSIGGLVIPPVEGVDGRFHAMATALAAAWIATSAMVFIALKNRRFFSAFKYLTASSDLVLLTAVLTLADGPRSPMLLGYFLLIALAGLRASARLVAFATAGATAGYCFLLLDVWVRRPELAVPLHHPITTVAALILCGIIVGQIVSAMRRSAMRYAELERASKPPDVRPEQTE
jgi:hypothetical protein